MVCTLLHGPAGRGGCSRASDVVGGVGAANHIAIETCGPHGCVGTVQCAIILDIYKDTTPGQSGLLGKTVGFVTTYTKVGQVGGRASRYPAWTLFMTAALLRPEYGLRRVVPHNIAVSQRVMPTRPANTANRVGAIGKC